MPPVTPDRAADYIERLRPFSIRLGLDAVRRLAAQAGNPQEQLRFVHLAGTNGKGSTAALLESALRRVGIATGLYTSPHLIDLRERFRINGRAVTEGELAEETAFLASLPAAEQCSYFEFTTVLALRLFRRHNCEAVIWETGMGGRLDATNLVDPLLSVITNIALDHQQYLGNTIGEIAAEKAGIVKARRPVFCGVMPDTAREVIRAAAAKLDAPFFALTEADVPPLKELRARPRFRQVFELDGRRVELALPGVMQRRNAALAGKVLAHLAEVFSFDLTTALSAWTDVRWPGRLEQISDRLWLDGGHNPDGVAALREALTELYGENERFTVIFGAFADKEVEPSLTALSQLARRFVFTVSGVSGRAALSPETLCAMVAPIPAEAAPDVGAALAAARRYPERTLVCGSLYLVGAALRCCGGAARTLDLA